MGLWFAEILTEICLQTRATTRDCPYFKIKKNLVGLDFEHKELNQFNLTGF